MADDDDDPVIDSSSAFLEHTIEVTNETMREKITIAGYTTLAVLVKREPVFAKSVCANVR